MNNIDQLNENLNKLNGLLEGLDLSQVSSESNNSELPDGYYLVEVVTADFTSSKSSGDPMVSFRLKVVENGCNAVQDDFGKMRVEEIPHTQNRNVFKHYPFPTQDKYKSFVGEMMRFEDNKESQEILREAFQTAELMLDALDTLVGRRIYIQVSTSEKNGNKSTFTNIISFKRAEALGLPTD